MSGADLVTTIGVEVTALDTGDLAVITGPLEIGGNNLVFLEEGEVVRIITFDSEGSTYDVLGMSSGQQQWIDASALTPLWQVQNDPEVFWGEKPYVTYSDIHDYVYTGDYEGDTE